MNIERVRIVWHEHLAGEPEIRVLVDEVPARRDLRYERKENWWFAEEGGYIDSFEWDGDDGVPGGHKPFTIFTVDDEEHFVRGPCILSASLANMAFRPLGIGVSLTTDIEEFDKGYVYVNSIIAVKALEDFLVKCGMQDRLALVLIVRRIVGAEFLLREQRPDTILLTRGKGILELPLDTV